MLWPRRAIEPSLEPCTVSECRSVECPRLGAVIWQCPGTDAAASDASFYVLIIKRNRNGARCGECSHVTIQKTGQTYIMCGERIPAANRRHVSTTNTYTRLKLASRLAPPPPPPPASASGLRLQPALSARAASARLLEAPSPSARRRYLVITPSPSARRRARTHAARRRATAP